MKFEKPELQNLFDEYDLNLCSTLEYLEETFKGIRAGRANPYLLNDIKVDYYGTPTPINQIGTISIPEARMIVISVWDLSALKNVEKAITAANIGVNPQNDGKVIRLVFPELTEERRQQLCKEIKNMAEQVRVTMRNHRRTINDTLKKMKKDSAITEDELELCEKEVDKMLSSKLEGVDKVYSSKEKEILTI